MALVDLKDQCVTLLRIIGCIVVLSIANPSLASTPDVYWSGFAFEGDFSAIEHRYPHSKLLSDRMEDDRPVLDTRLEAILQGIENNTFQIVIGKLGSIGPDAPSSIALAFVLDRETVSVEHIGDKYKLLVAISAQALFFDFKERAVVSTFPMSLIYVDVQDTQPTEADKATLVENLYLGSLKANVFDEFAKVLATAKLNTAVTRRIQVTVAAIDPTVVEFLPPFWQKDPKDFGAFISQQFGRSLSENQNVPVLPFTKGHAIGNRMSAIFANGDVYSLAIPEADYSVSLSLEKLVKKEYAKVPAGTSYIYGAYMEVKVEELFSGRSYFENTIKNGAYKVVPATQKTVDDWPAYQDSLLGLIDTLTAELSDPSKEWAKKHIGDGSKRKDLKSFGKVVQSCR